MCNYYKSVDYVKLCRLSINCDYSVAMESPQMYDSPQQQALSQVYIKKMASNNNSSSLNANNNNNNSNNNSANNNSNNSNNNSATSINHGLIVNKQQGQLQLQQGNNNNNNNNNNSTNNNVLLQKQILQHYSQSDLEELTSQEISLDLQHLIDDQFREQEALGIFSELVPNTNNNTTNNNNNGTSNNNNNNNTNHSGANQNGSVVAAAKVLQLQQQQQRMNQQSYPRTALAYMPQPVHTGATYTNNSSDENSSIGSDATNIKEEPIEPIEYRRLAAAAAVAVNGGQFIGASANQNVSVAAAASGLYQIPPNYASNGSGNTFTTLPTPTLHHQGLPHLPGNHLANLKHKQMMSHRKQNGKHVDKGTDEYRRRRERNNIAVRKSREKAKVRSREVEERVKALIKEKDNLVRRLEEMNNEIQLHKQLYVHLMNHNNPEVNNICRNVLSLVSNDHGM